MHETLLERSPYVDYQDVLVQKINRTVIGELNHS